MIIPCGDDLVVESEHDALLLRLGVVVAEQVKQTVDEEVFRLPVGGTTVLGRLASRDGRAQHDVAEQT